MIRIFKTVEGRLQQIHQPDLSIVEENCWIALTKPSIDELKQIADSHGIYLNDLKSALDEEEGSRIVKEENYTMILLDIPATEEKKNHEFLYTIPFGVILTQDNIITVCLEDTPVLTTFMDGRVRDFNPSEKSKAISQILFRNATLYLQYLRIIHKKSEDLEKKLRKTQRNEDLMDMLELKKSLVYITTSLRGNESVLEKLLKSSTISSQEDQELIVDVIIENKQAIEMAKIYSDIMRDTMDTYASVISNNLNGMMKILTLVFVVLSVPTIIFSAFGMNVAGIPLANHSLGFLIILLLTCIITAVFGVMVKKSNHK